MSRVYFSPGEGCQQAIIAELESASNYVDICVFTISDNVISRAIDACHKRGINVRIITDNDKMDDRGSDIRELRDNGLNIRMDQTSNHMHHKFAIIDGHTLITGSYNWTRSAYMYNHENILITSEADAIQQYADEFENLWEEFGR
jgi:mitochondrial cardiolipin hydrolase